VSSGGPDLFVICKSCGSEVSPYITECPYCGNRLRKRAPKLDRDGRPKDKPRRPRRSPAPSLGPLRRGEIPGIRHDARPYLTIAIVVASLAMMVLTRAGAIPLEDVVLVGDPGITGDWWRVASAAFVYENSGYAFVALFSIAIFGWLMERRHGPVPVALLFALGGIGGLAVTAVADTFPFAMGANGAALALVTAWALPDVLDQRKGREIEGDLLGAAVVAIVLLLLPLVVATADALAGATGLLAGLVLGLPLARLARR
jgi:membrane associated rhomboid family serine protease